jgi:hypothetical protein
MNMKLLGFFLIFSTLTIQMKSQIIEGKVLDSLSGAPLEYASIGVINTSIGAITDEKGYFKIDVNGQSPKATLRISMISYKPQTFTIEELSVKENIINLIATPMQLAAVVIQSSGKIKKVGTTNYTRHGVCGWGGTNIGKGSELGIKIKLGDRAVRLQSMHIRVHLQSFDSCLFRLHIRNIVDNLPLNELLNNEILIPIATKSGWVDIDLSKYNLVFNGDIALTLEWLKVIGVNKDRLIKMNGSKEFSANVLFSTKKKQGVFYSRWANEDKWTRLDDQSPSFYLTVQE